MPSPANSYDIQSVFTRLRAKGITKPTYAHALVYVAGTVSNPSELEMFLDEIKKQTTWTSLNGQQGNAGLVEYSTDVFRACGELLTNAGDALTETGLDLGYYPGELQSSMQASEFNELLRLLGPEHDNPEHIRMHLSRYAKNASEVLEELHSSPAIGKARRQFLRPTHFSIHIGSYGVESRCTASFIDRGSGQSDFKNTFLRIGESQKRRRGFVGNMGIGMKAVFQFCDYAVILSCHRNDMTKVRATIVRKVFRDGIVRGTYEYLGDQNGEVFAIPSADAEKLMIDVVQVSTKNGHPFNSDDRILFPMVDDKLVPRRGRTRVSHGTSVRLIGLRASPSVPAYWYDRLSDVCFGSKHMWTFYKEGSTKVETTTGRRWQLTRGKGVFSLVPELCRDIQMPLRMAHERSEFRNPGNLRVIIWVYDPRMKDRDTKVSKKAGIYLENDDGTKPSDTATTKLFDGNTLYVTYGGQTVHMSQLYNVLMRAKLGKLHRHIVIEICMDDLHIHAAGNAFTNTRESLRAEYKAQFEGMLVDFLRYDDELHEYARRIADLAWNTTPKQTSSVKTDGIAKRIANLFQSFVKTTAYRKKRLTTKDIMSSLIADQVGPRKICPQIINDPPTKIALSRFRLRRGHPNAGTITTDAPDNYTVVITPLDGITVSVLKPLRNGRAQVCLVVDDDHPLGETFMTIQVGKINSDGEFIPAKDVGVFHRVVVEPRDAVFGPERSGGDGEPIRNGERDVGELYSSLGVVISENHVDVKFISGPSLSDPVSLANWQWMNAEGVPPERVAFRVEISNGVVRLLINSDFHVYRRLVDRHRHIEDKIREAYERALVKYALTIAQTGCSALLDSNSDVPNGFTERTPAELHHIYEVIAGSELLSISESLDLI